MSKIKEIVEVSHHKDAVGYKPVSIDNYVGAEGERALTHAFILDSFRKIMGRTLTLIDSSITDKQQNKAMKDIVRNIFSDEMDFATEFAFDQEVMLKMAEEASEGIEVEDMESVTIEEALGVK